MVEPEEAYSLGQSVKESIRLALRQTIVLSLVCGGLGALYGATDPREEALSGFILGFVCGPPLWLLLKFIAFVFPGSWWRSLRRS